MFIAPAVLVLVAALLVAGVFVAWRDGRLNPVICGGDCGAENAIAPTGLRSASTAPASVDGPPASPTDLDAVLASAKSSLGADVLGDHVGLAVGTTDADGPVVATTTDAFVPASTTKLLTSYVAVSKLDPQARFATEARLDGDRLFLVGGGDPYLTDKRQKGDPKVVRADLATLAASTAARLKELGTRAVTLGMDTSLFSGPDLSPDWPDTYVRDNVVTPIEPLWIDRGMVDTENPETTPRVARPAEQARDVFATYLRQEGITVTVDGGLAAAPDGARTIGSVHSSTVAQIVESTVRTSDDEAAEVLLRHLALAAGKDATFADGTAVVEATLKGAGISTDGLVLTDGSGLSRANRISPTTLVGVVRASLADARFAPVLDDLPVSGFSGTLADRYATVSRGWVRAKTGMLTGVHSLAGIVQDAEGRPIVFAAMADDTDRSDPFGARAALDKVAAAIAAD